MKYKFNSIIWLAIVCFVFAACQKEEIIPEPELPQPGVYSLPIIETTDIHGHIVDVDAGVRHYRLAYIADKVKDIRGHDGQYDKDKLLLVDGGDLYQGTTVSTMLSGKPIYVAMDMMDYDAVALGNHEFDWNLEDMLDADATLLDYEWGGAMCANEVPVLCANLYKNGSRAPETRDYVIVEKTAMSQRGDKVKVKVGIVGMAADYSSSIMVSQFSGKGYSIREDYTIVNDIARNLEQSGQCDATILLIHGEAERAASHLSDTTAFDLVLGGHTHIYSTGETDWGLVYAQGGRNGTGYAYAELKFEVDGEGNILFSNVGTRRTIAIDENRDQHEYEGQNATDLDAEILTVSDSALAASSGLMEDVLGHITVDATTTPIVGSGDRSSIMGNWMCDIYRSITHADVAFVNSGGIRTQFFLDGQPQRDVTANDVYTMFPFGNEIYVYQLTYAELLQIFEYSMTSSGKSLFSRVTGIDCRYTQSEEHTTASGSTYRNYYLHSLSKDGTVIYQDSTWTGDWASRTLTVAVNNYIATTNREDSYTGLHNPLIDWTDDSHLMIDNLVDNENAVRVLRAEGNASNGLLFIDTTPHYILLNE